MPNSFKLSIVFASFAIFAAGILTSTLFFKNNSVPKTEPAKTQTESIVQDQVKGSKDTEPQIGNLVVKVIDGDTIEIEGGRRVRYIGIDTPETVHPNIKTECFGQLASNKNKELVEGKRVRLEKDISETDKYGRLLRYVYSGDTFINDYLVRNGYANASSYPPDIKHQNQFRDAEKEARDQNKGLWGSCDESNIKKQDGCLIKGNVSTSGQKIYHIPGQKYYEKTVINEAQGEKWFCSEEDAQNEGFRKSKT